MKTACSFGAIAALGSLLFFFTASDALAANLQVLHGHVPAATASLQPLGNFPGTNQLNLAIGLPLRNQAELSNLLGQIYDPSSPDYHHYLTPEQFTERFGPTEADYQAVVAFANANGLRVTATHPNRVLLDVSGTVTDVERALHVTLRTYRHPTENRTFYALDTEPSLDLAVPILHISGLDNYSLPHPRFVAKPLVKGQNAVPNAGSGPSGTYMGNDFHAAYAPSSSLNGSGQIVGLLQFDGYTVGDITYYESQAGLPNVTLQNVLLDGFNGIPSGNGGEVEVSLDIEMAISMATNLSEVIVYEAPDGSPFEDILNRMVTDNLAKQLSCSWFVLNGVADPAADVIFQEMAAQGQSFFSASGDNDAYTGLIDFPGDTPYITQVGGTTLTTSGPGGAWVSETVWNWGSGAGSGGGISTQYPIPSWQTNISMTANQGSTTMRNTPDVALTADNIYVRADGSDYSVGGTSCASPLWAGFAALINQQAATTGQPPVGFVNPAIYAIGKGTNYNSAFHDITTGNNESPSSPTKFSAVSGYDLCTGWGTPAGQGLINALANPEALLITPAAGFASAGGFGGPFTVTSENLLLTNVGINSLTWTLVNTSAWLTVSSAGGTITPGGAATTVRISLNTAASNLVAGAYNATVWFTNLNDNVAQSRQFNLSVISPPVITAQPTNQSVLQGGTAIFTVTATGGLPLSYQWRDNGTNLTDGGNISGSTTTNLFIGNVSSNNVGTYTVTVTNIAGAVISSNALLTIVSSPPVIIIQPTNETVIVGGTAGFSVTAIGSTPLTYQWKKNGTNLVGQTSTNFIIASVQTNDAGIYAVAATNAYGSAISSNAVLTVLVAPPCDPAPSGLVAWWQGEGNAYDSIGTNNGTPVGGIAYTNGEVGQAFVFNNTSSYIPVPASPSLNIGTGSGVTIECWVKPNAYDADVYGGPVIEWDSATTDGLQLWTGGSLFGNIIDTSGNAHALNVPMVFDTNNFQHVALTYDKSSGLAVLYYNGTMIASNNFGNITPQTTYPVNIGRRTGQPNGNGATYGGLIDELSLYNRALSSSEIAAVYNAGSKGKCFTPVPPLITSQPTNQTVVIGGTATFSVQAVGTQLLTYLWNFDGTNILGATNTSLTLTNVQLASAGNYSVAVTNAYGSAISSNALLTVLTQPPTIIMQPSNQTVIVGGTAGFSVTATGSMPLTYQWKKNGTNIIGATGTNFTILNAQTNNAGIYAVAVTNAYGSAVSSNATLTVLLAPPCDSPPSGLVSWWQAEGNANDSIGTNNGTAVGGVTYTNGEVGRAFMLDNVNTSTSYIPVPASPSLNIGTNGGFTIECWVQPDAATFKGGAPIIEWDSSSTDGLQLWIDLSANIKDTSGNAHTLVADGLLSSNSFQHVALTYDKSSGKAFLYCNGVMVASNNFGNITPQTTYPVNIGRRTGQPIGNGSNYGGLIDELSLYNRALSSNEVAAVYNAGSAGKCPVPPAVLIQPTNQTVIAGATAAFSVQANGSPPLFYQWLFNATNILGATNTSLTLTNVQPVQGGTYTVLIANAAGSITSSNAILTVNGPPSITTQPVGQTNFVGATATFTVIASGSTPLRYQWNFNGTNLVIATNAALVLTNIQFNQAGNYAVLVTNAYGFIMSSNAALVVNSLFHFVWNPIPSPRFAGVPFGVAIQAQNPTNGLATNFTGAVFFLSTNGVPVAPAASGNFTQGNWTGAVTVAQSATNLVLRANDSVGETGLANPINIVGLPPLTAALSGNTLYIFWPVSPAGFVLETTPGLSPASWVPVAAPPIQIGDQYLQPVQMSGTNAFYHLRFTGQ
jgi:hypothetical protein